jgi:hypothetical protein
MWRVVGEKAPAFGGPRLNEGGRREGGGGSLFKGGGEDGEVGVGVGAEAGSVSALGEALGLKKSELEDFDLAEVDVPVASCRGGWSEKLVVLLLAAVYAFQKRGIFNTVRICDMCEEVGAFEGIGAPAIRRKWRELLEQRVEAALKLQAKYRWALESKERASTVVGEGVNINRRLPDGMNMRAVIAILEEIMGGGESDVQRRRRQAAKSACPPRFAPWSNLVNNPEKVGALLLVAVALESSETGFLSAADALELAGHAFEDSSSPWARPYQFRDFILRYLPIVSVDVRNSNQVLQTWLCAKSPESDEYIVQLATLARAARENSIAVQEKLKSLPIRKYLLFLSQEQDRKVFKGLIAQLTGPKFVQQQFDRRKKSIAAIVEELDLIGYYLADLDNLTSSLTYSIKSSSYKRRKMRARARAELAVTTFLRRKGEKGGRPSKLLKYSCCLGRHVEEAVAELSYGRKADRRQENASLHRGGTARLIQVWKIVSGKQCCTSGENLQLSLKTVHRAMHPARSNTVAGKQHKGYADIPFHKVRSHDKLRGL